MPVLPFKRHRQPDAADVSLASLLGERRASAAEAEDALRRCESAGAPAEEVALARRLLVQRLGAALEAAEAAYRTALGPVTGIKRTAYLARLARPEVRDADRLRREIALARTHVLVAARDDLTATPLGAVPPSVGTAAIELGTHAPSH